MTDWGEEEKQGERGIICSSQHLLRAPLGAEGALSYLYPFYPLLRLANCQYSVTDLFLNPYLFMP